MCRVFGCVAAEPVSIRHELLEAENPLIRQSEDHDSGWGMAVYDRSDGCEPTIVRFPEAAHADGDVSWEERQAIMGRLDQAGAGPEERRLVEYELSNPTPVEAIIREAQAPDTAAEVYLASNIAIRVDTDAERAYMDYLASRLRLTPAARQELDRLL